MPRYFTYTWWDNDGNPHQATRYQYYLIEHATLHVPANLVESYKQTFPWNMFGNIVALTEEETKIEPTLSPLPRGGEIYNLQGQRVSVNSVFPAPSVLPKGVYIVDGKKVWVK